MAPANLSVASLVAVSVASSLLMGGCFRAMEPSPNGVGVAEPAEIVQPDVAWLDHKTMPVPREGAGVVATLGADRPASPPSDPPSDARVGPLPPLHVDSEVVAPGAVRLRETATVFAEPDASSPALGLIAAGARLAVVERVIADGCPQAWLGVAPYGYVCSTFEESATPVSAELLPHVPKGRRVPGTYGRVSKTAQIYASLDDARLGIGGHAPGTSLMVRRMRRVKAGGASFWKTRQGWIASHQIRKFSGSRWHGVPLGSGAEDALTLPLAWVLPEAMLAKVAVKETPSRGGKVLRRLSRRELVELSTGVLDHGHFELRGGGYIEKSRLAVAKRTERPDAAGVEERWLDIDVSEQTLVAYEGDTPVYVTMISSGKAGHSTPTGVFRLSRKVAERTMKSMADSKESYSVAKVPWTVYFATGYALHASYWHDGFGNKKSHGCVNLSPLDARALYAWTAPLVAPGWSEVYGHAEQPGSVVRIRSRRTPEQVTRGYAKTMLEAQAAPTVLAQR
ncbi:MAG: L,D-transpeptidase [Nannocystaceae bacterium]|nr:L,D-transpeptidase [Nannocystaceae bacterium]